jgi:hypothetical protein
MEISFMYMSHISRYDETFPRLESTEGLGLEEKSRIVSPAITANILPIKIETIRRLVFMTAAIDDLDRC